MGTTQPPKRPAPRIDPRYWYETLDRIAARGDSYETASIEIGRSKKRLYEWGRTCAPELHARLRANAGSEKRKARLRVIRQNQTASAKELAQMLGITTHHLRMWLKQNKELI